jgi:hypothetical protein
MRFRYQPRPPAPPPDCLIRQGPLRAYHNHKRREIVIETAADHPAGLGLEICRLPKARMAEARAIVALYDLLKSAPPFAALGRCLATEDPAYELFAGAAVEPGISAGDAQALAAAYDRALGPAVAFERAVPGIAREPRPGNKP